MIGLTGIIWIPLLSLLLYKLDYTKLIRKKKDGKNRKYNAYITRQY